MLKQGLKIGNIDTSAYGVYVTDAGIYTPSARSYDMIQIAGRSGDLEIDNNRFDNGTYTFPACIIDKDSDNFIAFKGALNKLVGYQKITDPFLTGYYREGIFVNDSSPKWSNDYGVWVFNIKFNAKPQLFLKEGQLAKTFTTNSTIKNPTGYITKPLIRLYGIGTLGIGDYTIIINTAGESYIDFDCETMDAYEGSNDRNSNITVSKEPYLNEDLTGITLTGLTRVDITPRWYTII